MHFLQGFQRFFYNLQKNILIGFDFFYRKIVFFLSIRMVVFSVICNENISEFDTKSCSWIKKKITQVHVNLLKLSDFKIHDGKLYKNCGKTKFNLCVAKSKKKKVVEENHINFGAGHAGYQKALWAVQKMYFPTGMYRNVKDFVRSCMYCHIYRVQ